MSFWKKLAGVLTKGAVWAAGHPDEVIKIVNAGKKIKKGTKR